ncbi:MAG: polyprenyl synthetase family protein [Pseudomonadota bacterium]
MDFSDRLNQTGSRIETTLDRLLAATPLAQEIDRPNRLLEAMRYSALGGGKRLRPFLIVESARLCAPDKVADEAWVEGAFRTAAALEMIHCYSLVHDDLPAMDDDDLRRGKPTTHKAFDEATAILAGDALLTYAFDVVADPATHTDPSIRAELTLGLARAAGLGGMAGGQMLDLEAEGDDLSADSITRLQAMKTGALIRFGCEGGAVFAGAPDDEKLRLKSFGEIIGRAFQLADDLLDVTASSADMGKKTGKDADMGKATLVGLYGVDESRSRLDELVAKAHDMLSVYGDRASVLRDAANFIAQRTH